MTVRQRSAGLAILLIGGVLTAALVSGRHLQGAFPVPARLTQGEVSAPGDPIPPPFPSAGVEVVGPASGVPCPADPPTPVVSLSVRVPACATVGQELTYRICVENQSAAAAHHVLVRNPLPANAKFLRASPEPNAREAELVWYFGTLQPCECREICLVVCPLGPCDLKSCARVRFEHGQCVCTRVEDCATPSPTPPPVPQPPQPSGDLVLRKSGPANVVLFEPFTFRLTLANTGSEPAVNVVVADQLPPALEPVGKTVPLTWNVGTLDPGKEWTTEYQVIARQEGKWCNNASVTAQGGQRQEASACVVVNKPRLDMKMTAPAQRSVGTPIRYHISVGNPSQIAATNVTVANPLPPGTTFEAASDGGQVVDGRVVWSLGTIPAGMRKPITLTLKGKMIGELTNKATATADRHEPAEARALTTLDEGTTGLTFDIDDITDPLEVGMQTTYLITVRNQGTAAARKVTIKATVPQQLQVISAKPQGSSKIEGQVVTFESGDLDPGKTATFEVMVKAVQAGEVRFVAELNSEVFTSGQPVRKEESTTIYNP